MPTIGHIEPVSATNWETAAINRAASWLDHCRRSHQRCSTAGQFMPTRLLDIGNGPDKTAIRLIDELPEVKPYVALSYCWGLHPESCLQTRTVSIEDHRKAIPLANLPLALAQIVQVCRALGYNLLWIDALCIIQDSAQDWSEESRRMGLIYSHADLVIENGVANDCRESLHMEHVYGTSIFTKTFRYKIRNHLGTFSSAGSWAAWLISLPSTTLPSWTRMWAVWLTGLLSTIYNSNLFAHRQPARRRLRPLTPGIVQVLVRQSPLIQHASVPRPGVLNTRAWPYQETTVPRRLLSFLPSELKWKCYDMDECECQSHMRDSLGSPILEAPILDAPLKRWNTLLVSTVRDGQPTDPWPWPADSVWRSMVRDYSQRDVTQPADRLAAFASIAEAVGRIITSQGIRTKYLAGHWEHTLVDSLNWTSNWLAPVLDMDILRSYMAYALAEQPDARDNFLPGPVSTIKRVMRIMTNEMPSISGKLSMTISADRALRARKPATLDERFFPSWSWASSSLPVTWPWLGLESIYNARFFPRIELLKASAEVWEGDSRKRIITGTLNLKGSLVPIRLRSTPVRPPDVSGMRPFPEPSQQGYIEFFDAFLKSRHLARFANDIVCCFSSDSPCLYGTMVANAYEAWGPDLLSLLQTVGNDLGGRYTRSYSGHPAKVPLNMFPCELCRTRTYGIITICEDARCWCHFGWTEPEDEPFWAVEVGRRRLDILNGSSTVHSEFLVLRRVPNSLNSFWRVGCGSIARFSNDETYLTFPDPFKGAERREVVIV